MGRALIQISDLSFRHSVRGPWLWHGLNFRQAFGESVVVMGASGCGKSSLLRLLLGTLKPEEGSVELAHGTTMSMVFQDHRLLPWKNSEENVLFGITRGGWMLSEKRARAEETLRFVRAGHLAKRFPHELSGGEKQRIALARAIVEETELILMDEPLSAIDEISRQELLNCLCEIRQRGNTSILYVTHSREEATALGDRVLFYREGKLQGDDLPLRRPAQRGSR